MNITKLLRSRAFRIAAIVLTLVCAAVSSPVAAFAGTYGYSQWAGYTQDSVTRVSADFIVPNLSGSAGQTVAFWVGFGQGNPGIQQTGITGTVGKGFTAWWQMYPGNAASFRPPTPPHPGDTMQFIAAFGSGVYTLTVNDVTRGWSQSTRQASPNREGFGEDITEKYTDSLGHPLPLPDRIGPAKFLYTSQPLGSSYSFSEVSLHPTGRNSFYVSRP